MALDNTTLQQVATLARLRLDDDKIEPLKNRLNDVLALVDELQEADVANLKPLSHPLEITQPLREDQVTAADCRDKTLPLAPASEGDCFLVPQVIE